MVIKSFNVSPENYEKFSKHCKEYGLSMSKQVDMFMQNVVEEEPEVREEYLKKLQKISKEPYKELKGSLMDEFMED